MASRNLPDSSKDSHDEEASGGELRSALPPVAAAVDPVEEALAGALTEAAKAGRFDVVAQLAKELEARRMAAAGNVVAFHKAPRRF